MKNKDKAFFSLYFGAFGIATGFLPFTALSLLISFSKRNVAGSGISAIGKLGKNVLNPTLSNALPAVGLAISALDFFAKDNDSKTKEYSNKASDNNYFYEPIIPKFKPYEPIIPKFKPYEPIKLDDFKTKFDF